MLCDRRLLNSTLSHCFMAAGIILCRAHGKLFRSTASSKSRGFQPLRAPACPSHAMPASACAGATAAAGGAWRPTQPRPPLTTTCMGPPQPPTLLTTGAHPPGCWCVGVMFAPAHVVGSHSWFRVPGACTGSAWQLPVCVGSNLWAAAGDPIRRSLLNTALHPLQPAPPLLTALQLPGLLYTDGRDSRGRPVVVVNVGALPRGTRKEAALDMLVVALAPVVQQVGGIGGLTSVGGG